jgi:hypothetical protein
VARDVQRRRTLGSWFRTVPKSEDVPLGGVPIPLLSNLGRAQIESRYGNLEVCELRAAVSTHSMWQIFMLFVTLRDTAFVTYYFEQPTVSRASMEDFARTVHETCDRVAAGTNPPITP